MPTTKVKSIKTLYSANRHATAFILKIELEVSGPYPKTIAENKCNIIYRPFFWMT